MSCDLFYSFPPQCQKHLQNKPYQIKVLMQFMREKCSPLIHQCKHSTVMHNNEYIAVSFVNLVDVFLMYIINVMVGKIITLMFLLEDLTTIGKCYPCPKNVDFVGTIQY